MFVLAFVYGYDATNKFKGLKMSNFLRVTQVAKKVGIGKSTVWLWVKEGKFPKPIKISSRVTVWDEEKIIEWQNNKCKN